MSGPRKHHIVPVRAGTRAARSVVEARTRTGFEDEHTNHEALLLNIQQSPGFYTGTYKFGVNESGSLTTKSHTNTLGMNRINSSYMTIGSTFYILQIRRFPPPIFAEFSHPAYLASSRSRLAPSILTVTKRCFFIEDTQPSQV